MTKQYTIVEAWDWDIRIARKEFTDSVNKHMADGWELEGSHTCLLEQNPEPGIMPKVFFMQSMTREVEVE